MVSRTIVCETEASHSKVERLRPFVEEWQRIARYCAEREKSFQPWKWGNVTSDINGVFYKPLKEPDGKFSDILNQKLNALEAIRKVDEAYSSYKSHGAGGDHPLGRFGDDVDDPYIRIAGNNTKLVSNDRGYGLKANIEPYGDPLWLHLKTREEYQEPYIRRVVDGDDDASVGCTELRIIDDDEVRAHIAISYDMDVTSVNDIDRYVGIDIGENVLYAAAVIDQTGTIEDVEIESGRQFRHYREMISQRMSDVSGQGNLKGLKEKLSGQRDRYTDNETNVVSRNIVDLADDHRPSVIVMEDLTGYRETADDPIHDWPTHKIREKIAYKAEDLGIPVVEINPAYTSQTCSSCGHTDSESRDGRRFVCTDCGYDVDADFNAAVNIANKYRKA